MKQSPLAWFEKFTRAMRNWGCFQSQGDHTLFIKNSMKRGITALIVCVNDIVVTGDDHDEITCLKAHLANEFEIKDLRNLRYFLGIEVARSRHKIYIFQQKYTQDVL